MFRHRERGPDDLTISGNAAQLIRKMTVKNGIPGGGLRIAIKAGGCSGLSYTFAWEGKPRDGDHVFDGPEGVRIFVDPKSHRFLEGTTLDYDTSLVSKGFIFHNPNAKSSCGCGTSFSV
jgi:iron-sulfur cluster assembly protein